MNAKTCARCEQSKETDRFKSLKTAKDGLNSWCIDCQIEYRNTHVPNKPKLIAEKEGHKVCRRCATEKPFQEFSGNKKIKSGLNSWCKACMSDYSKNRCTPKVSAIKTIWKAFAEA